MKAQSTSITVGLLVRPHPEVLRLVVDMLAALDALDEATGSRDTADWAWVRTHEGGVEVEIGHSVLSPGVARRLARLLLKAAMIIERRTR